MQTYDIKNISSNEPDFPSDIAQLGNKTTRLYYMGNRALLTRKPRLGIVGTRKPTTYGRQVTTDLARAAARRGVVIVSGLAHGVDGIAHKAMVDVGGQGIAVLPSPLDNIYPRAHQTLAQQILHNNGLLISEYPSKSPQMPYMFVVRNSIVAALSQTLLVTEAAHGSGSRHTFSNAIELQRTVACVPGNITSPMSDGTNQWIRDGGGQGVHIITSVDDLMCLLKVRGNAAAKPKIIVRNIHEQQVIDVLLQRPCGINDLQTITQLPIALLNMTITMMEIDNTVEQAADYTWRLKT